MTPTQKRRMREQLKAQRLALLQSNFDIEQLDKFVAPRKPVANLKYTYDSVRPCNTLTFADYIWHKQCGLSDEKIVAMHDDVTMWAFNNWRIANGINRKMWEDEPFENLQSM